jgi:hypothetical protein
MEVLFTGTLTAEGEAARYTAHLGVCARRFARLLAPVAVSAMRRQDEQHMRHIVRALEAGHRSAKGPAFLDHEPRGTRHGSPTKASAFGGSSTAPEPDAWPR